MNRHEGIDKLVAAMGGHYGEGMKFFRDAVDSPNFVDIIDGLDMEFTPPVGLGEYHIPVRYGDIEAIARYTLLHWEGPDRPSIIAHHGSGETAYTARLRKVFPASRRKGLNIIAVSVPFNESMKQYLHGTGCLKRFSFMFASSALLTEHLVASIRDVQAKQSQEQVRGQAQEMASSPIVCTGISLGGWITNLHFARFGTCDLYKPVFAGAAPDDLFRNTVYRKLASKKALAEPEKITAALNFEEYFSKRQPDTVFPLMARYDQYVRLERQQGIYLPGNISIIEKGHVTGAGNPSIHRNHILGGLSPSD